MMVLSYHIPVLLNESIEGLNIKPNGIYVDLTMGGAGHSSEILNHLSSQGRLYAFDQDPQAAGNIPDDERIVFINHNFRFFINYLRYYGVNAVDGIMADLGVSSFHFEGAGKGFSFKQNDILDMRMSPETKMDARDVINESSEEELTGIFRHLGELKNARKIAAIIVSVRTKQPVERVFDLTGMIHHLAPKNAENKFFAKVFQAIRIAVNHEIHNLKQMLLQVPKILKDDGRFVVISYHSLEDRLAKNFIKTGNFGGDESKDLLYGASSAPMRPVNKKVIVPGEQEILKNNKARSAKMRIAEKNP